jgi:hypothetical protein
MSLRGNSVPENITRIAKLVVVTLITGALLYLPVYLKYGWSFFSYYDTPYPSIPTVLYKFFVGVWGVVGSAAMLVAVGLLLLPDSHIARKYLFPRSVNEKYVIAWLIAIDLYIIAYLRLPMESGYLIPIVPFVILIFGKYLYNRAFAFFAVTLILSSFLCSINPVERNDAPFVSPVSFRFSFSSQKLVLDLLRGPVNSYQSRRKNGLEFSDKIVESLDTVNTNTLLVVGKWYNQLYLMNNETETPVTLRDYISQDSLLYYVGKNYRVYYLPQQDYFNQEIHGYDINLFGAEPYLRNRSSKPENTDLPS